MVAMEMLLCILVLVLSQLCLSEGSAMVRVKPIKFWNLYERTENDECCDVFCTGSCDHQFMFCLDHAPLTETMAQCSLGMVSTDHYPEMNIVVFQGYELESELATWPGGVTVKAYARDHDGGGDYEDVDRLYAELTVATPGYVNDIPWQTLKLNGSRPQQPTSLQIEYAVYCMEGWTGPHCNVSCTHHETDGCIVTTTTSTTTTTATSTTTNTYSMQTNSTDNVNVAGLVDGEEDDMMIIYIGVGVAGFILHIGICCCVRRRRRQFDDAYEKPPKVVDKETRAENAANESHYEKIREIQLAATESRYTDPPQRQSRESLGREPQDRESQGRESQVNESGYMDMFGQRPRPGPPQPDTSKYI